MTRHEERADPTRREPGTRIAAWLALGALGLAGCAGSPAPVLGEDHPANPRAAAAAMTASAALASYRTPQDFAGRLAAEASAPDGGGHGAAHGTGGTAVAQADGAPSGAGTVNAVNPDRRTVNLSHDPISSLGWPAMTMDFPVGPSVELRALRPGTRVRFTLRRGADGMYAIDSLVPAADGSGSSPAGGSMPGHGGMGGSSMPGHGGGTPPKSGGHQ